MTVEASDTNKVIFYKVGLNTESVVSLLYRTNQLSCGGQHQPMVVLSRCFQFPALNRSMQSKLEFDILR